MHQGQAKPKRVKKVSNSYIAWIILSITLGGLGSLLFLTSKPPSIRYIATCKPFMTTPVVEAPTIEDVETPTVEESEPEVKEEELIQMTQAKNQ